jgi:uncharacterized protein YbaP (TraB family)
MRKLSKSFGVVLSLFIFLIPGLVEAQGNLQQTNSTDLHCLWKAQGDSNVVYLLGSVHLLKSTDYPLAPVIGSAFTNSQIAVFETDIEKLEDPGQQQAMMGKVMLPANQTLRDVLSSNVYEAFSKHAAEIGLPMGIIEKFRPASAVMSLELMELTMLGANPQLGVDKHFFKPARNAGKTIIPLETPDFQIALLVNFTTEEENLLVEKSLEDIDNEKKLYNEMVLAWKTGDSASLEKMLNKTRSEAPSIFKKLVSDRTAKWLPEIEKLLHGSQDAIVIVGAGHLVGPDGLVELLRKKGIKVTQL